MKKSTTPHVVETRCQATVHLICILEFSHHRISTLCSLSKAAGEIKCILVTYFLN